MQKKFKIKHLIWDWNGTLINDVAICCQINNEILKDLSTSDKKFDLTFSLDRYRECFTVPVDNFWKLVVPDITEEERKEIGALFYEKYQAKRTQCPLHDEAKMLLEYFKEKNIPQYILSAHPKNMLEKEIANHNITAFFEEICGDEVGGGTSKVSNGKSLLSRILNRDQDNAQHNDTQPINHKTSNLDITIVGDSVHDYEVASALGIRCVLFSGGIHAKSKLEATGALVVDRLSDLCALTN